MASLSGTTKLYVDDKVVAQGPMKTQPGKFTLSGDGLCVGYDSGDAVSQEYKIARHVQGRRRSWSLASPSRRRSTVDLEKEAARAFNRD